MQEGFPQNEKAGRINFWTILVINAVEAAKPTEEFMAWEVNRNLPIDSSKVGLSPHWTNPQFFYFREQQIMWKSHLPISSSLLMVSYPFHQHLEQCRKHVDAVYTQPCLTAEHKRTFFISKPPSSSKFMACSIHKSGWEVSVCIWNHIKPNIQKSIGLLARTNQLLENRTARWEI